MENPSFLTILIISRGIEWYRCGPMFRYKILGPAHWYTEPVIEIIGL
jgi:hypothetical protein